MILAAIIYSIAVCSVLGFMIRTEHQHMGSGREPVKGDIPVGTNRLVMSPIRRDDERMTKALYQWMTERSDSGSAVESPMIQPASKAGVPEATPAGSTSIVETHTIVEANTTDAHGVESLPEEVEPVTPRIDESATEAGARSTLCDPSTPLPGTNYYELLQISPNADLETIQRVYRFMAGRFHPDNPKTGDNERFLLLKEAFEVLVDPERRAKYDAANNVRETQPLPIFGHKIFLDGIEGEMNRRFGVLSLLYYRRRIGGTVPGLSLLELERRMAFPREYLEFTVWYLQRKGYIALTDANSDYALTELGVDYVETHSSSNKVVRELLAPGPCMGSPERLGEPAPAGCGTAPSAKEKPRRRRRSRSACDLRTMATRAAIGTASRQFERLT
jgi:curved DNA-binding protein